MDVISDRFSRINVLREDARPLLLSSAAITHPKTHDQFVVAYQTLVQHNVGTILNVSSGEQATSGHLDMYRALNIRYVQLPIDDTIEEAPRPDFLDKVLETYQVADGQRAFLVNCSAGINRSALAAGAILWTSTHPRPWHHPTEMIEYMRHRQKTHRGFGLLLVNPVFFEHLVQFLLVKL